MLTFDTVRELGGALPDVVEGTAYAAPALKLSGKLLACVPTNKSADANSIVVRIDPEQRAELLKIAWELSTVQTNLEQATGQADY